MQNKEAEFFVVLADLVFFCYNHSNVWVCSHACHSCVNIVRIWQTVARLRGVCVPQVCKPPDNKYFCPEDTSILHFYEREALVTEGLKDSG